MSWLREGSIWVGPEGNSPEFHGAHGAPGGVILKKLFMAEEMGKTPTVVDSPNGPKVEDKGVSGEEAKARATERFNNEIGEYGDGPKVHKALFDRGYIFISDEGGNFIAYGKNKADLVRAEEEIMRYLSKGPVTMIFDGSGAGFEMTLEDVESSANFDQAMSAAQARANAGSQVGSSDFGIWMSKKISKVKFDRP